jgi:hypothetical protein
MQRSCQTAKYLIHDRSRRNILDYLNISIFAVRFRNLEVAIDSNKLSQNETRPKSL